LSARMKTVVQLGLLVGILPALAIAAIIELSLNFLGARDWPDLAGLVVFGAIYLALICGGAYLFSRTKY
jgi:hypothetical protein